MKNNLDQNKQSTIKTKLPIKRSLLLLLIVIGLVASMFISSKYVFNNAKLGNMYGDGIRVTIKLQNVDSNQSPINTPITKAELTQAENSIYTRTTDLGYGTPTIDVNKNIDGGYSFTITQPNIDDEQTANQYLSYLTVKSNLSFYTTSDKSLFDSSGYNPNNKPGKINHPLNIVKPNSAKYTQERRGSRLENTISFDFKDSHSFIAYTQALSALKSKGASKGENRLVVWVGYDALWQIANQPSNKDAWDEAGKNLYNFAHVYKNKKITPELKTSPFNARDFLISDAPVVNDIINQKTVYINNTFQPSVAKSLAERINYGTSSYALTEIGRYSFVNAPFGKKAIQRIEIAALIILSLIIITLIGRYGIFGVVSSLILALFVTTTLLLFTIFQGEFTLITIGAIILGVLLMLDYSINTFERLKKELYEQKSTLRAINAANRYSVPPLFDATLITLIVCFSIFYIGTKYLPGFSLVVIIATLLSLIFSFILINLLSRFLIKLGALEKRNYLIGNIKSKTKNYIAQHAKLESINYSKHSKWALFSSIAFIFIGVITFSTFAGISGSFLGGVNANINLTGGEKIWIRSLKKKPDPSLKTPVPQELSTTDVNKIYQMEAKYSDDVISIQKGYFLKDKNPKHVEEITIIFKKGFNDDQLVSELNSYNPTNTQNKLSIIQSSFTNFVDKKIIQKVFLAILLIFAAIVLYTLFRFRWTFSLTFLLDLIHDGLIITTIFIVCRIPFSSLFAIALLMIFIYSIFNKILIFNRMKRNIKNNQITNINQLAPIVHKALGETFYRNMIIFSLFLLISFATLIPFTTNITFSITLIIGSITTILSTYFVLPWIWIWIEKWRYRIIEKQKIKKVWDLNIQEEQSFENINDIKSF